MVRMGVTVTKMLKYPILCTRTPPAIQYDIDVEVVKSVQAGASQEWTAIALLAICCKHLFGAILRGPIKTSPIVLKCFAVCLCALNCELCNNCVISRCPV